MNKKAQIIDSEIISSPGFAILALFALSATVLGWFGGKRMGFEAFPIWQLIIIMLVEVVASYIIAARMS